MNYDKLEFKPAHEFWNEAKNELGYSWMDVYVEEYGDSTEFILNNEHANTLAGAARMIITKSASIRTPLLFADPARCRPEFCDSR